MDVLEIMTMLVALILYFAMIIFYYAMIGLSNAVMVASYVMQGLGFSAMAKHRGIERPWLAWVPVAGVWVMGSISDQYRQKVTGEDPNLRKKLLVRRILYEASSLVLAFFAVLCYLGLIITLVISESAGVDLETAVMPIIPFVGIVLLIVLAVCVVMGVLYFISQYKALFDIFRSSDPKTSTLFFVLSFFSQIALTLGIFLNRYKTLGVPPEPEEISAE